MANKNDALVILKLYELRREKEMRKARQWFSTEFSAGSAQDILSIYKGGERLSANFRVVVSYWDMASSLVLNGHIDEKTFLEANTEHIFVYAKVEPFLNELREVFRMPDFLMSLETLCKKMPDFENALAVRKSVAELWKNPPPPQ